MKDKIIIRKCRKIVGFTYKTHSGYWFSFGKPSAPSHIAFECQGLEDGVKKIEEYSV